MFHWAVEIKSEIGSKLDFKTETDKLYEETDTDKQITKALWGTYGHIVRTNQTNKALIRHTNLCSCCSVSIVVHRLFLRKQVFKVKMIEMRSDFSQPTLAHKWCACGRVGGNVRACIKARVCVYLQQGLKPGRLPVSEVEEAVSGVMGMQTCHSTLVHCTLLPEKE